jgi:tRNA G10  N-methylase Trm11
LIEAHATRPDLALIGTDFDRSAMAAACDNAARASCELHLAVADAGQLPLRTASIDRILCNPPWGKAVRAAGEVARDPHAFGDEVARVLADDGIAVLLGPIDFHARMAQLRLLWETRVHVFGQWASMGVLGSARGEGRSEDTWRRSRIGALLGDPPKIGGPLAASAELESP